MDARREEGQTAAEYAVVLALLTLGIVGLLVQLNGSIIALFATVLDGIA